MAERQNGVVTEETATGPSLEALVDLLVYAPLGLALAARELVPELAARGRAAFGTQVEMAKAFQGVARKQGHDEIGKLAERAKEQIGSLLEQVLRSWAAGVDGAGVAPADAPAPTTARRAPARRTTKASGPGADLLAIPGYDSLSASQVLPLLAGLSPAELEAVRAYEAEHRGRRTVLGRVDQLQA